MSAKKPPLWVIIGTLLASAVAISLACRVMRRPADPPQTLTELIELLRQSNPPLYVLPWQDDAPEQGVYICQRPQRREKLQ